MPRYTAVLSVLLLVALCGCDPGPSRLNSGATPVGAPVAAGSKAPSIDSGGPAPPPQSAIPDGPVVTFPTPGGDEEPPEVEVFAPRYPGSDRTDAKSMHMQATGGKVWQHNVMELQSADDLDTVDHWYQKNMAIKFREDKPEHGQRVIQLCDQATPSQQPATTAPETWVQLQTDPATKKTIITITSTRLEGATPGPR